MFFFVKQVYGKEINCVRYHCSTYRVFLETLRHNQSHFIGYTFTEVPQRCLNKLFGRGYNQYCTPWPKDR